MSDVCWLVCDARLGVNVWLDLDSLARGLGRNKVDVKNQWLAHSGGGSV